jgi:hypothetical protein
LRVFQANCTTPTQEEADVFHASKHRFHRVHLNYSSRGDFINQLAQEVARGKGLFEIGARELFASNFFDPQLCFFLGKLKVESGKVGP